MQTWRNKHDGLQHDVNPDSLLKFTDRPSACELVGSMNVVDGERAEDPKDAWMK